MPWGGLLDNDLQNAKSQLSTAQANVAAAQAALSQNQRAGNEALAQLRLASTGPQVFALALLLAYLVMGAQFNSFRYPLYLLLPVPFAIAGALWFVYFSRGNLDISAKNAILYLDFVMQRLGRMPLRQALVEAAFLRFRPIVMTTLTVLAVSFPLILSRGAGSEFGKGLGVVILGGILLSAILTFFVVSAAFYFFERNRPAPAQAVLAAGGAAD